MTFHLAKPTSAGPGKEGNFGPYVQVSCTISGTSYSPDALTQSERRHIYKKHLDNLLERDQAYRCFCSAERLDALRMEARRTKSPTHYDGLCRHLPQSEIDEKLANSEPFVVRFRVSFISVLGVIHPDD